MRDFRDAKVMARALRDALKAKTVDISHSESLELMAKTFDCENWNILSAKIDAARPHEAAAATGTEAKTLHCSFCRRSQHEVLKLIAGPSVFICNACVGLCDDILEGETTFDLFAGRRDAPPGHEEDLVANLERARKHLDEWRGNLERIRRTLSARETGEGAPAHPDNRPTAELRELIERHERALARYESTLARVRPGSQNSG